MQKGSNLFYILGFAWMLSGCQMVGISSPDATVMQDDNAMMRKELAQLRAETDHHRDIQKIMVQYEERIAHLEAVVEPLAPLKENNMAVIANNVKSEEEAGGGALSEVFYLVQTAFSELDAQAASLTTLINDVFHKEEFIQENLYAKLEDKVVEVSLKIAEVTVRRSQHMAADRRLVTSRLKALNESFLALKNLAANQVFDLSFSQHKTIFDKADSIRVEYAKILKSDFFPVIPQLVPLASGEEYLNVLKGMNETLALTAILKADTNGSEGNGIYKELSAQLTKKTNALK